MSTKRKKSQEEFNYDMIQRPKSRVVMHASATDTQEAEENSKRSLRLMAYMGLEKIRLKVGNELDWYNLQLRLHVGERMVDVVELKCNGISEEDMAEFKAIAEEGILTLNGLARRINAGITPELYVEQEESKKIELALNLTDEMEDVLNDLWGKIVVYKLYRDTKDHLICSS